MSITAARKSFANGIVDHFLKGTALPMRGIRKQPFNVRVKGQVVRIETRVAFTSCCQDAHAFGVAQRMRLMLARAGVRNAQQRRAPFQRSPWWVCFERLLGEVLIGRRAVVDGDRLCPRRKVVAG
jgi:hypothetical protein